MPLICAEPLTVKGFCPPIAPMSCPLAGARSMSIRERIRRLVFLNIQAELAVRSFILRDSYTKEPIGDGYCFRAVLRASGKIEPAFGPVAINLCIFHFPFCSSPDADLVV